MHDESFQQQSPAQKKPGLEKPRCDIVFPVTPLKSKPKRRLQMSGRVKFAKHEIFHLGIYIH